MARKSDIDLETERLFENAKIRGEDFRLAQHKYYWATALEFSRHEELIKSACKGKRVLEIGCSDGSKAVLRAPKTKSYLGIDISDVAIDVAISRAIPNATFAQADGHDLEYGDATFDCVITDMLLHHLDLNRALPEIKRVLKPGGKLLFFEPLGFNPFFVLYRALTPKSRTPDEKPFTYKDLNLLQSHFEFAEISWTGFTVILAAFIRKKGFRQVLSKLDAGLARTPLRYLFWQISGVASLRETPQA